MSLNNSNCNDSNEPTFIGEDLGSKPISLENHMKEKNLEILMLKATVTKLESSLRSAEQQLEFEKVLVETLQQELGSLTSYQVSVVGIFPACCMSSIFLCADPSSLIDLDL